MRTSKSQVYKKYIVSLRLVTLSYQMYVTYLTNLTVYTVLLAPYYFCHKTSLDLVGSDVLICPFDKASFLPDWDRLGALIRDEKPVMVCTLLIHLTTHYIKPL